MKIKFSKILQSLVKIISYQPNPDREGFILGESGFDQKHARSMIGVQAGNTGKQGASGGDQSGPGGGQGGSGGPAEQYRGSGSQSAGGPENSADKGGKKERKRLPKKTSRQGQEESPDQKEKQAQEENQAPDGDGDRVRRRLDESRRMLEGIYGLPLNRDIILREFTLGTDPPVRALIIYIDGLVNRQTQQGLLQDLMLFSGGGAPGGPETADRIMKNLLPGVQMKKLDSFEKIADAVNYGDTAFFFEGASSALVVETKGWEHRTVDRPENEQTITGPKESFVENLRVNTSLVRKIIRSTDLYTEMLQVGSRFRADVAMMYINDLANPELVDEVKKRISGIRVDYIADIGMLEQFIEDSPYNLNPQALITERPDRVAAALAEGRVALIMSGSPFALVVPTTMFSLLHTGEETYLRWQYGTFIRYIRSVSFYLALLLPGAYLAVVLFHQEMVPTELLLAIAGNRERVPFPTVIEMLLMEFSFELVREAGLRIPSIIGSTIGIVGALILGQAAVQANIVSPILVILVAVTGLASFSIPNYQLAFTVRIYRFFYILMGALLGFYGITIGLFVQILFTANLKAFGVPFLAPSGPRTYAGGDVVYRLPLFLQRRRPDYINPLDDVRMPGEPRGWVKGGGGGDEGDPDR